MRRQLGRLVAAALVLSVGLLGQPRTVAPAEAAPSGGTSVGLRAPGVRLPHPAHGRRAVELLGDRLDAAARVNGLTAPGLRALLLEDTTAWVGETGRVYFKDQAPALTDAVPAAAALSYPLASTFLLHSKPGSQRVIFLDFDGADVSGTLWNEEDGVRAGRHPAWSLDADATTFNTTERTAIQSVWQRVAEDYAPFDVDVTTQFPGEAAITRSDIGDAFYGTRALISPSADALSQICGGGCGGVAFFDVFDEPAAHASLQPAWIFPQTLGNDTKAIAEAVSHEVGHNLGLDHDGQGTLGYYEGHAAWAPIMGVGYDRPITQWSRGGYTGANNQEDDLAIIAGNGTPRRIDEAGATIGGAGQALPAGSAYITSRADVDVYELGWCSGAITVAARPAPTSPNLDIKLSLLDAGGSTLSTDNPLSTRVDWDVADGMSAALTRSVPAATYFVAVDGVGHGTPITGYDDYGSLGAYTLELSSGSCSAVIGSPSVAQGLSVTPAPDGRSVAVAWTPPASDGGSPVTGYTVTRTGAAAVEVPAATNTWSWTGLEPGTAYTFTVAAINANGAGPQASTTAATPDVPSAARIGPATSGALGGSVTATATWTPPVNDGGAAVLGYQVHGYRLSSTGQVLSTYKSALFGPSARTASLRLPAKGRWRFAVRAQNSVGYGPLSARSNIVRAR